MARIYIAMAVVAALVACDSNSTTPGQAGGPCYGNGTCDEGLVCKDEVCSKSAVASEDEKRRAAIKDDPTAAMPKALAGLVTCLGKSNPKDLADVTPEQVAGCFEKKFGNVEKIRKKGKCKQRPEVVVETGPLNPCTFEYEERKPSRKLDADYTGLGRVNAIFMDGGFVGFTMLVARPTENKSLDCSSDDFVKDAGKTLAALGDDVVSLESGPDVMTTRIHDGVVYSIHSTKVTKGFPVERTVYAMFVESEANKHKNTVRELDPGWFPKREEDIQLAQTRARGVFRQVGSGKSGSARAACAKGDLLGLLGKPVRKTIRTCEFPNEIVGSLKFKGASYWKYWPVMHTQIREADARMKLHGVGAEGRVMEVFVQVPDPGRKILSNVDSTMGEGTEYGCGGRAWVIDEYVMRARPAGKKLNLAFTLLEDYDAFSILVPQASVYANWR